MEISTINVAYQEQLESQRNSDQLRRSDEEEEESQDHQQRNPRRDHRRRRHPQHNQPQQKRKLNLCFDHLINCALITLPSMFIFPIFIWCLEKMNVIAIPSESRLGSTLTGVNYFIFSCGIIFVFMFLFCTVLVRTHFTTSGDSDSEEFDAPGLQRESNTVETIVSDMELNTSIQTAYTSQQQFQYRQPYICLEINCDTSELYPPYLDLNGVDENLDRPPSYDEALAMPKITFVDPSTCQRLPSSSTIGAAAFGPATIASASASSTSSS